MNPATGDGKVAIHRWFPTGEGWAAHPWLFERQRELIDALAGTMVGAPGEFAVLGLGGTLVGEKTHDAEHADPQARDLHPMIVRVVFAPQMPSESRRRELLEQLRKVPLPAAAGPNITLELPAAAEVSVVASSDGFASLPPARRLTVIVGLGVIAVLVMILGLRLILKQEQAQSGFPGLPGLFTVTTPKEKQPALPPADDTALKPVNGEVPYLRERTKLRFEQVLGRSAIYDHPYVLFVKEIGGRLPEKAPACRDDEEVAGALRSLLGRLNPELRIDDWPVDKLRAAIDLELSYEKWRQGAAKRAFVDRGKPLDEPLRRFVEQFRRPDKGIAAAVARMAEALRGWHERDVPAGPFAVIDRFFEVLTRPSRLPDAIDHVGVEFLRRLPTEPVAAGRTFDTEDELATALRHLLYLLDREFNPLTGRLPAVELVDRIVGEMRFAEFAKKNKQRHYRDANVPASVENLWRRFE